MRWIPLTIALALIPLSALAFESTILYDRQVPPKVVARPDRQVRLKFDQPILSLDSTAPAEMLDFKLDPDIATMAILTGLSEEIDHMLYVTTTDERVYTLWLKGRGKAISLVHIQDEDKIIKAAMAKQQEANALTPDEENFKHLLYAMWGFPAPRITTQVIDQKAKEDSIERVTILRRYDGPGYYGFTQKIEVIGPSAIRIHPSTIQSSEGPLFAVSLDGHQPPITEGSSPYLIQPGSSVLLHTVYKRGGMHRAPIR